MSTSPPPPLVESDDALGTVPKVMPDDFASLKGDVVIVSSDEVRFPFRRTHLASASVLFESLFDTAEHTGTSVTPKGASAALKMIDVDAFPTVPLSGPADQVELFLRHIGRDLKRPLRLELDRIETLLVMGDKYEAPPVMSIAFLHLTKHTGLEPTYVFGAAVAYGNVELARHALKDFSPSYFRKTNHVSGHVLRLADVPARFLEKFGRTALLSFSLIHEGVYEGRWSWAMKAADFVM